MARYIDAELFADRLLNAWTTADKEKKSEIVAILSNIVTPILVGTPTADVAPRAEVAIKIFSDIEKIAKTVGFPEALVNGMIVNHILDGLYIDSQDFAELKKRYTEEQK